MSTEGKSEFWEEWRRKLHEDYPEVKPEYSNRLGIWHHDFDRIGPWQDENGNTHYWSQECFVSVAGGVGGFNRADLLRRGWTRTAIKRILGGPDGHNIRRGYRKDRPECVYERERVLAAEAAGKMRFRRAIDPEGLDYWEEGSGVPNRGRGALISASCKCCWGDFEYVSSGLGRKRKYCSTRCRNRAARKNSRKFSTKRAK